MKGNKCGNVLSCSYWLNADHWTFLFKKAAHQRCRKTMHSFLDAGSHPDSAFIFYESFFLIMYYPITALNFFLFHFVMLWMLFNSFSYVTFLTSICEITYVLRWFRTDDSGMICCKLTPTLYHCATEDHGHVLLFFYILNLHWIFKILNINVSLCL